MTRTPTKRDLERAYASGFRAAVEMAAKAIDDLPTVSEEDWIIHGGKAQTAIRALTPPKEGTP